MSYLCSQGVSTVSVESIHVHASTPLLDMHYGSISSSLP